MGAAWKKVKRGVDILLNMAFNIGMTPMDKAIEWAGGLSMLAGRIGASPQAVLNWRKRGIPAKRVLDIEKATEGRVSRHELRPDLYPEQA